MERSEAAKLICVLGGLFCCDPITKHDAAAVGTANLGCTCALAGLMTRLRSLLQYLVPMEWMVLSIFVPQHLLDPRFANE